MQTRQVSSTAAAVLVCALGCSSADRSDEIEIGRAAAALTVDACGDTSGLQATAPWPMRGGCPAHQVQSAFIATQTPDLNWTVPASGSAESDPVVGADGTAYFAGAAGFLDYRVFAIRPDGSEKWRSVRLTQPVRSTPAIAADGALYVGSDDNHVHALNPDGTLRWKLPTGGDVRSSPAIGADGTIYVGSDDDRLYALRPDPGLPLSQRIRWSFKTGNDVKSSPAIGPDGTIYVGSDDNRVYALNPNGSLRWSRSTFGDVRSSPAVRGDRVYVGSDDNHLYALRASDGHELWRFHTLLGDVRSLPAIGPDGSVYFGSDNDFVYAVAPNGTELWRFQTGDDVNGAAALGADGALYVSSTDGRLYALRPDGSELFRVSLGDDRVSSPAIGATGTLYVTAEGGGFHSLGNPNDSPGLDGLGPGGALAACSTPDAHSCILNVLTVGDISGGGGSPTAGRLQEIALAGAIDPLFNLGEGFDGGLVYHPRDDVWYAVQNGSGGALLHRIALGGAVTPLFTLGAAVHGLAYRPADQRMYAIVRDAGGDSLIDFSSTGDVQTRFFLGMGFDGGLTYNPSDDRLYAIHNDSSGSSTLYSISQGGAVVPVSDLGDGFRGGLAYHPGRKHFYTIGQSQAFPDPGFSSLYRLDLQGELREHFGLGFGLDVPALSTSPGLDSTAIWVNAPLFDERFVESESVRFDAIAVLSSVPSGLEVADAALQWTSDLDGPLGVGASFEVTGLSLGQHTITVSGYGLSATFPIRVFPDLTALYLAPMASGEINRILRDFEFVYHDGTGPDEQWQPYFNFAFNTSSSVPNRAPILAKLDVLRRQRFAEPLPMTAGKTIYEHIRETVKKIILRLDCGVSTGGGNSISLSRNLSLWAQKSRPPDAPEDFCKGDYPNLDPFPYTLHLGLLVHETRHTQPGDPLHFDCIAGVPAAVSSDRSLDAPGASGFAWATLYYMWLYQYALHDSLDVRCAGFLSAQSSALGLLQGSFCNSPTHANPLVQSIVDDLLGGTATCPP